MIKDNQKLLNRIHFIIDAILTLAAYLLAYYLRFNVLKRFALFNIDISEGYYSLAGYAQYLVFIVPAYLIFYTICGLYKPKRLAGRRRELFDLIKANLLGIITFGFLLYTIKEIDISRWFFGVFSLLNLIFDVAFRLILSTILHQFRKKGFNQKHILLVGYSWGAEGYIDRIIANPQWGYHIHGILDDSMEAGTLYKKVPVIGNTHELKTVLEENELDEIIVTLSIEKYGELGQIVGICEKSGVHTKFVPDYHNIIPTIPLMEDMNGLPVINIRSVPLSNILNRFVKRLVDVVGALLSIVIFSIPMITTALIIKFTSPGPIIYSQVRVGLHNKEFRMYKFRSMEIQPEHKEKKAWTTANDPRITKIGNIIRKTSIDELPQLFNVLYGNMSLVGPRPERPFFVEKFKEEIPRYMIKHQVRPGLTGWAQVNGYRGDTSIRKRIDCDLYYIENWTLGLDIKILFMTIFKGFVNKNAY